MIDGIKTAEYYIVSLFCGAGGLDEGFWRAGFSTCLAIDKCADAVRTYNLNANRNLAVTGDLATLAPKQFLSLVPQGCRPVGLVGGPPCQGFSRGNVCADPRDPRNRLPFRYAALLKAANEAFGLHFFVFENVAGLLTPKHTHRLKLILSRLESAGFTVFKSDLDASKFGVPQRRRRLFIVGLNKHIYPNTKFDFPRGVENAPPTVADAIRGLPPPAFYNRNLTASAIPYHPNHWTMVPKSPKFASLEHRDGRSFKQLSWDKVSPTVAYGNREIHIHPDGGRRLSVYEAMLLQGFPHDYQMTGSLSAQVTQVSNAVPPPVAEAIARSLRSLIGAQLPALKASYRSGPTNREPGSR